MLNSMCPNAKNELADRVDVSTHRMIGYITCVIHDSQNFQLAPFVSSPKIDCHEQRPR